MCNILATESSLFLPQRPLVPLPQMSGFDAFLCHLFKKVTFFLQATELNGVELWKTVAGISPTIFLYVIQNNEVMHFIISSSLNPMCNSTTVTGILTKN